MKDYSQDIIKAQNALNEGNYKNCVDILSHIIEHFPVTSKKGTDIRLMLITALSGINRNEEALIYSKQLLKSKYKRIKDEAKYLVEILNSPSLKTPENWNISFNTKINEEKYEIKNINTKNKFEDKEQFIDTYNIPTGETKSFKKGFIIFTFLLMIFLISVLSGCVKINNTIDMRSLESINIDFQLVSKYINKTPLEINFEEKLRKNFPGNNIQINNDKLSINEKSLSLDKTSLFINKILKSASESLGINLEDINIESTEKNYLFCKKLFINLKIDLQELTNFEDLEIYLNIINPSQVKILNNIQVITEKNTIKWLLKPGELNQIYFSFLYWNKFLISTLVVILIVFTAYVIRKNRYELGTNLPKLPS